MLSKPNQDLDLRRTQTDIFLELAQVVAIEHQHLKALFEAEDLGGVTPGQSRALMILFQARAPITARELGRRLGVSEVTAGRFVKGLESGGWIDRQRDPSDKRAWLLHTTPKARDALPRFIRVSNKMMDELFFGFDEAEVRHLRDVVARIRQNLDRDTEDQP